MMPLCVLIITVQEQWAACGTWRGWWSLDMTCEDIRGSQTTRNNTFCSRRRSLRTHHHRSHSLAYSCTLAGVGPRPSRCHSLRTHHHRSHSLAHSCTLAGVGPHAGSGVVRIDLLNLLAGGRKRRPNRALSVLSLSLGFFECVCTSASDWLERLVSEITYDVLTGTLNPTHSLHLRTKYALYFSTNNIWMNACAVGKCRIWPQQS